MSTLKVTTIQDTAGSNTATTEQIYNGIAKVWVNFNGSGTIAIRADYNVTSISDNGIGDYTVNFTTALSDANYAVTGFAQKTSANSDTILSANSAYTYSTTAVQIGCVSSGSTREDALTACISVFR